MMGWSSRDEDFRADHFRDERKNSFEPLPHRLDVPVSQEVEIALLIRNPNVTLKQAVNLIEQYGKTKASEGAADAVLETGNRLIACIEAPLAHKEPSDAEA